MKFINSQPITHNSQLNYGFTLIETVIYVGLLSIMLVVLSGIFLSTLDIELESESASSIEQDGRFILARLIYDIERADNIVIPVSPGITSSSLQLTISGVNYIYNLNNNKLDLNQGGIINNLNGYDSKISNLSFQRLGNPGGKNSIRILFTATSITQRSTGTESKNFQTAVAVR